MPRIFTYFKLLKLHQLTLIRKELKQMKQLLLLAESKPKEELHEKIR